MTSRKHIDVSVIIPVGERNSDLPKLYAEYRAGLQAVGGTFESIFVLDGPRPQVLAQLQELAQHAPEIIIVGLSRPFGEATALMAGFQQASGQIVVTLPAYHQIQASELPKLVAGLQTADMVVAERWPRAGGFFDRLRRNTFHRMIGGVTGARFHDLGCGARVMKRRVLEEVSLYGDQHRFLPLLADRQGFRVAEVRVRQSDLDRFKGTYRAREYTHRALDIFTVFFLVRFTRKPLRFFGMVGVITFGIGAVCTAWVALQRLVWMKSLADRPALLLASLMVVLGLQLFAIGLLGELIIFTHARNSKDYQIDQVIHFPGATPRAVTGGVQQDLLPRDEHAHR